MKGIVSKTVVGMLLVTALIAVPVTADITIKRTDGIGWTYQRWDFDTEPGDYSQILPEIDQNPYAVDPVASISELGESPYPFQDDPAYYDEKFGRSGVLGASPVMGIELFIPNSELAGYTKIVQVEMEYRYLYPGGGYITSWLEAPGQSLAPVWWKEVALTDGWYDLTLEFRLPQPDWEEVFVLLHDSGVYLDFVEVATVCVPVPGAVLLGMFGLSFVGVKLRRFA